MIELRTLGTLSLVGPDGSELQSVLVQPKRVALLTYLAVSSRMGLVRRDPLVGLFWPEHDEARARASLRQALYEFRQELGQVMLVTRGDDEVGLNSELFWCDVSAFEAALAASDLELAVSLYRGSFLAGFSLRGSVEFDQWMEVERDRLARTYGNALERLAEVAGERGEAQQAAEWWRRLIEHDPYATRGVLRFMEALESAGDRAGALEQADRHAARMLAEMDAEPSPDVVAFAERLRRQPVAHEKTQVQPTEDQHTAGLVDRLRVALSGRYAIEREIGSGGMAAVYLAQDLKHHRKVAVKVLRPELAAVLGTARFLREIEITANLNHPHILPLLDSGEAEGFLFYVMPLVEGESLRDRLNREKQLPISDAVKIASEVADALGYAHGHNVIHRDVKPENVMLEAGHAVVADFGIARAVTEAGGDQLTETGVAIGTPAYLSPEQGGGERELDGRSDQYSLGCVLHEMLTGEPPFTGPTAENIIRKHISAEPTPVNMLRPTVPEGVARAVKRALSKSPADRFKVATDFAVELERAPTLDVLTRPRPSALPRIWKAVATALAAAAVAVGGWWAYNMFVDGARIERLAVLPPANLTGDPEQAYFVDGMHDALIAELGQIAALTVISRQSVLRYRDTEMSIPEIARELGVDAVVEPSVFRAGDTVRITAQLLRALPEERHLWAESYDRDLRDVLALYSEVARAIATEINVTLTSEEAERLAAAGVVDPAAYEDYLRGQYEWNKLTAEGWEAAIGYLQQSIDQDPSYAPAYAMMSLAYSLLGWYSEDPPAVLYSRSLAAAERAVALDSSLAEAHASLAFVQTSFGWNWTAADRAGREALRINPDSPMALFSRAWFLGVVGRSDEATMIAKRAIELDPVAPPANSNLALHLFIARRYDEAIQQADKVLALEPDYPDALLWRFCSFAMKGMYEEAARTSREYEQAVGLSHGGFTWWGAWILALAGRLAEAREVLDQMPADLAATPQGSYFYAVPLGALGEKERAVALLEQAYQGRSAMMAALKIDPRLDGLRDDPQFQALLRRMKFPES